MERISQVPSGGVGCSRLLVAWACLLLLAGCAGTRDPGPLARELHRGGFAPSASTTRVEPDSLLVVSYNIAYAEQSVQAGREILADPRLHEVDILLLQEMDLEGTEALARSLQMNYVYCPAYRHRHHGRPYGTSVLSRWPLENPAGVVLPHPNPFSNNHRRAAVCDVRLGSRAVRAVSLHLSTVVIPLDDRLHQLEYLLREVGDTDLPLVVGGDFNSGTMREVTRMRQTLRPFRLRQVVLPDESTARRSPLDLLGARLQLDHFFYRGLRPGSAGLGRGFQSSDHTPIWCRFAWNRDWSSP